MDQELVAYLDRRFGEFDRRFAEFHQDIRAKIAASAGETRRHFDVVAEGLMSKIILVAEGLTGLDQKVDRLTSEMRTEFQKVDRRFLHLEARVIAALE